MLEKIDLFMKKANEFLERKKRLEKAFKEEFFVEPDTLRVLGSFFDEVPLLYQIELTEEEIKKIYNTIEGKLIKRVVLRVIEVIGNQETKDWTFSPLGIKQYHWKKRDKNFEFEIFIEVE
jgi:hypothetical protein